MVPTPGRRRSRLAILAASLMLVAPATLQAQPRDVTPGDRARDAQQVIVGRVTSVTPAWRTNDFGDRLIVSLVHVSVDETLKGAPQSGVDVEVEGGTIGTLTLRVSDLDPFTPGDRAVFYLTRNRRGVFVPHRRGLGLQKLDSQGHVRGSATTLDDIRREVRGARQP